MLLPKKTKYRKAMKGRTRGLAWRSNAVSFGSFGLQALGAERLNSRQIEAARRAMTRYIKRGGKVWIRVFPDLPVTRKSGETPMGSGKGAPEFFVARVYPGTMLFEMAGVAEETAREAMRLAGHKLPFKTRFVVRHVAGETE